MERWLPVVGFEGSYEVSSRGRVRSLVLAAFVGAPGPGQEAMHSDGDRLNNQVDNLSWGDRTQNMADQYRHGTRIAGEWVRDSSQSSPEVARQIGCDPKTIYRARGRDVKQTYRALTRSDLPGLSAG